ncbi:MAG: hypothetical protein QOK89_06530 [Nitrososphaeraceae archaeon]|nr:hypothetical protein [Nitrososphaeraceae archaeon]
MEVGQIVFRHGKNGIQHGEIIKVARKYFYVKFQFTEYTISKEDLMYRNKDYSHFDFRVYLTEQEILDENESLFLSNIIKKKFSEYGKINLSLDKLRRINEIIEE